MDFEKALPTVFNELIRQYDYKRMFKVPWKAAEEAIQEVIPASMNQASPNLKKALETDRANFEDLVHELQNPTEEMIDDVVRRGREILGLRPNIVLFDDDKKAPTD